MSKPDKWSNCPVVILDHWLWEAELKYDPYESSKAQAIHDILCGNPSETNKLILDNLWAKLTEKQWQEMLSQKIAELEFTLKRLKGMLDND
jgi:hypothetical protein